MRLFVSRDKRILGPFSPKEAADRIAIGLLSPLDEAWWDTYPEEVDELRELLLDAQLRTKNHTDDDDDEEDEILSLSTESDEEDFDEEDEEDGEVPWEDEDVWEGSPSLLNYPKTVAAICFLLATGVGAFWFNWIEWTGFALLAAGCLSAAVLGTVRSSTRYKVSTDRVEHTHGLLRKYSLELSLDDIRTIDVHQPGFRGFFGLGEIAFSDDRDNSIVFSGIWRPLALKQTIRELQNS